MYSIGAYGLMIADSIRTDAHVRALKATVSQGSIVLEIGTGATAFFAMHACKLGARRVYAVEPAEIITLAREIAQANGFGGRIEFINGSSLEAELPEKADVIISDLRGILPPFENHIPAIVDARKRLLAPKGNLIPQFDTMWAAVVESPKQYERFSNPWDRPESDFDLGAGKRMVRNSWVKSSNITSDALLTEPACWFTLDYRSIESKDLAGEVTFNAIRSGVAHGFCIWFDSTLWDDIELSNAPGAPELIWGNAFFPLSEPVQLMQGDVVNFTMSADLVGDDYIWRWNTKIRKGCDSAVILADFKQSTLFSTPLSLSQLQKRAASYVPKLNAEGEVDNFILGRMNGKVSTQEIARQLTQQFPRRFGAEKDALTRIGELAKKYSL